MPRKKNPRSRIGRIKENPATRVFRRGPQGRRPEPAAAAGGPQGLRPPPLTTAMPAGPQPPAIRVTCDGCRNGGNAGTVPASKETTANAQPAARQITPRGWKNSLGSTASGAIVSPARQIEASDQINDGSETQSWTGSSAFASSPPCGPATPVSALPPRLRRGRA